MLIHTNIKPQQELKSLRLPSLPTVEGALTKNVGTLANAWYKNNVDLGFVVNTGFSAVMRVLGIVTGKSALNLIR